MCVIGKKIREKSSKDGNLVNGYLNVDFIAIKGTMAVINTGSTFFQATISKLRHCGSGRTSRFA